jgi:hypothetical protein
MMVEPTQFQQHLFIQEQVEVVQQLQVVKQLYVQVFINQEMVELVQIYHLIFQV